MAERIYGLTEQDVDVLRQMANAYRRGQLGRPLARSRRTVPDAQRIYIAYTSTAGITARSSNTAGTGTVTLYKCSTAGALTSTTNTETAYNTCSSAVAANTYIQVKREGLTGRLLVDVEDCS